jgi:hypothetical protein
MAFAFLRVRKPSLFCMIATLTAFDEDDVITHSDTRGYPGLSLIWEHIGCQQNNRRTVRVYVVTDAGFEYQVRFPAWTPLRRYSPSARFHALLSAWSDEAMPGR